MKFVLTISLTLLFFLAASAQQVKVVGVSDGDSFTALFPDKITRRIRLHGIDCPERKQPFSTVAKTFTSNHIFGKYVFLQATGLDRYGRTVALVYLPDSSLLNERLLKAGLAWHFLRYDRNPKWALLENKAKLNRRGLWGATEPPIAPWMWRKTVTLRN